jgi:ribonuclease T
VFPEHTYFFRVEPFEGANIEAAALEFTGIKLDHPLRMAVSEETALTDIFRGVRKAQGQWLQTGDPGRPQQQLRPGLPQCRGGALDMKRNPFHPFSSFDTATLAGWLTARPCWQSLPGADIDFDGREAHSARYDTEKTAELFCGIVNRWKADGRLGDFND